MSGTLIPVEVPKLITRVCMGAALPDAQQNWAALEVVVTPREHLAALQRVSEGLLPAGGAKPAPGGAAGMDAAARSELLARMFARPLRFGEADVARSQSHAGDGGRLRMVMDKLLAGEDGVANLPYFRQASYSVAQAVCGVCPPGAGKPVSALMLGGSI